MVRVGDMQYTLVARVPATVVTGQGTADELAEIANYISVGLEYNYYRLCP